GRDELQGDGADFAGPADVARRRARSELRHEPAGGVADRERCGLPACCRRRGRHAPGRSARARLGGNGRLRGRGRDAHDTPHLAHRHGHAREERRCGREHARADRRRPHDGLVRDDQDQDVQQDAAERRHAVERDHFAAEHDQRGAPRGCEEEPRSVPAAPDRGAAEQRGDAAGEPDRAGRDAATSARLRAEGRSRGRRGKGGGCQGLGAFALELARGRSVDRTDRRGDPRRRGRGQVPPPRGLLLEGKRVAVVVPARDEEELIVATLQGVPGFVDRIYVVDDDSGDATVERARSVDDPRIEVVEHDRNRGVGAAIVTGYKRALTEQVDAIAVMAGDNQMDPDELEELALPVVRGELDYAKANRLFTGSAWDLIPRNRYLGNATLSLLTKIASGYWHVADSQAGYTVLSLRVLRLLDLDRIYTSYGFPNDMLVHLNVWNARVRDFPSRPIYGVGERSGIRLRRVVPRISWLLVKGFFWRMREKYVIRDFHPLVFFYALGFLMSTAGLALGIFESVLRITGHTIPAATIVLVALL